MTDANDKLGTVLRAERVIRGLTVEDVAMKVGASVRTVRRTEAGERRIDLDDVRRYADAIGVTPLAVLQMALIQSGAVDTPRS